MSLVTRIKEIATVDKHRGQGSLKVQVYIFFLFYIKKAQDTMDKIHWNPQTAFNKIQPEVIYSGTMMKQYIKIRRGHNIENVPLGLVQQLARTTANMAALTQRQVVFIPTPKSSENEVADGGKNMSLIGYLSSSS